MLKTNSIRSVVLIEDWLVTDRQTDIGPQQIPRMHTCCMCVVTHMQHVLLKITNTRYNMIRHSNIFFRIQQYLLQKTYWHQHIKLLH